MSQIYVSRALFTHNILKYQVVEDEEKSTNSVYQILFLLTHTANKICSKNDNFDSHTVPTQQIFTISRKFKTINIEYSDPKYSYIAIDCIASTVLVYVEYTITPIL